LKTGLNNLDFWILNSNVQNKDGTSLTPSLSLQEEFAGVVARAVVELGRDIESLRGRQVEGLVESLLSESFGG
jgi:hypothetical protein